MASASEPTTCHWTEVDAQTLVARLSEAIHNGDAQLAKDLVAEVSDKQLKLEINISKALDSQSNKEKEFSVSVHVESRETSGSKIELSVRSTDSVKALKRKVLAHYNIPTDVQRWIIGKKIPEDSMTLGKCGISRPGHTLFLYIVTDRFPGPIINDELETGGESFRDDCRDPSLMSPTIMSATLSFEERGKNLDMLLKNSNNVYGNGMHKQIFSPPSEIEAIGQYPAPPIPPRIPIQDDDGEQDVYDQTKVELNQNPLMKVIPPQSSLFSSAQQKNEPRKNHPGPPGWECPLCTFFNLPTRPGCEMCSTDRPEDYDVPEGYEMTDIEVAMLVHQDELERLTRQQHETTRIHNYNQWLMLDDLDLIQNKETFTCPICFDDFGPGEGIVIRDCLHSFCTDCLQTAVSLSEEPILTCPYRDEDGNCDNVLQQREIRALVSEDVFIKYLQRGLDQAESQAANSFHCKTTDCKGWCLYEDEVNFFVCPICRKENCLTCKVIHQGMNCKQYQADLAMKAMNDEAARKTQDLIEEMVRKGNAMNCPQCKIIVQKKDGCDWIRCSVCKTEICWVTKGPRWGPKGNGDTSAGCRCGVNDKRCHDNCSNCH